MITEMDKILKLTMELLIDIEQKNVKYFFLMKLIFFTINFIFLKENRIKHVCERWKRT